jgi:3-phytase
VERRGSGAEAFQRLGDLLVVVERDNRRLHVLSLPDFTHVSFIGAEELRRPYGITVTAGPEIYATDNFDAPDHRSMLSKNLARTLDERVSHCRLDSKGNGDVFTCS